MSLQKSYQTSVISIYFLGYIIGMLTQKQRLFCSSYVKEKGNAELAYMKVYKRSYSSIKIDIDNLLSNVFVLKEIDRIVYNRGLNNFCAGFLLWDLIKNDDALGPFKSLSFYNRIIANNNVI